METYKEEYNNFLKREKKAVEWLDAPGRTETEINQNMPHYEKILTALNLMISEHSISGNVILQGF